MIKRIITELMGVSKEEGESSKGKPKRPILEFQDSEKLGGILNENFPWVIKTIITNLDVSRILINGKVLVTLCM